MVVGGIDSCVQGKIARFVENVRRLGFNLRPLGKKVSYDPSMYSTKNCRAIRQSVLDTLQGRLPQAPCWRFDVLIVRLAARVAALLVNDGGDFVGAWRTRVQ